jgi:hypothetical protein
MKGYAIEPTPERCENQGKKTPSRAGHQFEKPDDSLSVQ